MLGLDLGPAPATGPKTVPELLAACRELVATFEQTKKDKGTLARAKKPTFTFAASQTPGGEPRTSFACGDPIYASLRTENYSADGFDVEWRLDGQPMGKADQSIVANQNPGNRPNLVIVPEESANDYSAHTLTFLKSLSKLTPGTHEIVLELVDRRGGDPPVKTYPGASLTITLACPSGADKYAKLYEKRRGTRLSMASWLPDPGTPGRTAIEQADARYHGLLLCHRHLVGPGEQRGATWRKGWLLQSAGAVRPAGTTTGHPPETTTGETTTTGGPPETTTMSALVMRYACSRRGHTSPNPKDCLETDRDRYKFRTRSGRHPGISRPRMCPRWGWYMGPGRQPAGRMRSTSASVSVLLGPGLRTRLSVAAQPPGAGAAFVVPAIAGELVGSEVPALQPASSSIVRQLSVGDDDETVPRTRTRPGRPTSQGWVHRSNLALDRAVSRSAENQGLVAVNGDRAESHEALKPDRSISTKLLAWGAPRTRLGALESAGRTG